MDSRQFTIICGAFIFGATIGGLVATCLWFRWYLSGGMTEPIVHLAGKEWGDR